MLAEVHGKRQHVGQIVLGAIFMVVGPVVALSGEAGSACIGIPFAVVGLGIAGKAVRHLLAQSAFEQLHFEALEPVPLGGTAELRLALTPRKPLSLSGPSKVLVKCTEKAVYSAGTSNRTYEEDVYAAEDLLDLPTTLEGPFERKLTVDIPSHLPPTWRGKSNSFVTTVVVRVSVARWPDLVLEAEVVVLPEVLHA
ncbi:MAG: hypothetical protein AMXMBFR34_17080 [Myxococcaceae bacterium]